MRAHLRSSSGEPTCAKWSANSASHLPKAACDAVERFVSPALIDVASGTQVRRIERDGAMYSPCREIAERWPPCCAAVIYLSRAPERCVACPQPRTYECFLAGPTRTISIRHGRARPCSTRIDSTTIRSSWAGGHGAALLFDGGRGPADLSSDRAVVLPWSCTDLADAHLARGYTLSNLRRYADANEHFEAAARINPNLFDAYYYYGRAAFAAGDVEKSIGLWRKAAEVRQEDFESPLLQAQSMRKLGRLEESRAVIKEAARRAVNW